MVRKTVAGLFILGGTESSYMRRLMLLITVLVAAAIVGSLGSLGAQNGDDDHPFATTWCKSPVIVPLATADAVSTTNAEGVVTARGASAVLSSRGPVVRMNEVGSRVQVTFDQTLFHTQWLFGSVDVGDSIRADAFLGRARQPIDASSVRGSMVVAPEQPTRGLTAVATEEPNSTGELDIFVGATEVLITNEGGTAVDLIAVAGCPAIELSTEVLSAPVWDAERQRFVAEHEVTFLNRLANPRAAAIRTQHPDAASTVIDDLTVDIAIAADGFRGAEVVQSSMSRELDLRRSETFDGVNDTGVLGTPLRLANSDIQRLRFSVAYEPDFDDASWAEGVGVPAPTISLRGFVDDVQVGVSARLRPDGAEVDTSTAPSRLVTPAPGLAVDHTFVTEPESTADGAVTIAERIVVANVGDTAVDELVVRYPIAEMYGPGTVLTEFTGTATQSCAGLFAPRFNGGTRSVAVYDETGLGVGEQCTIDLQTVLLPGIVPTNAGADYEAPVVATARSGRREVRDATAVQASLTQSPLVAVSLSPTEVTNLEDGRYRFTGSFTAKNTGDQNVSNVAARIDFATQPNGETTPTEVTFESIEGDSTCVGSRLPRRSTSGGLLTLGSSLVVGEQCTVDYSVVVRPGAELDGWSVTAAAEALSPRGLEVDITPTEDGPVLDEAPSIESTVRQDDITNNTDGTYRVTLTTTIANTGDTPLTSVTTSDDGTEHFGDTVRSAERIGDSCSLISWRRPLGAASQVGDGNTCSVTQVYLIEPGVQLTEWDVEATSSATSTSGAIVETTSQSGEIIFTEAPQLEPSIVLGSITKVDDRNVRLDLRGSLENSGDIELREVQARLDLDAALAGLPFVIETLAVDGAIASDTYDGVDQTALLSGVDEIASQARVDWRVVLLARTGDVSGPFTFDFTTVATSPATVTLEIDPVSVQRTVPLIQIIDQVLSSTNNNDGTYEIEHTVSVRNVGEIAVPAVAVTTDFLPVFNDLLVSEIALESTCDDAVRPGAACSSTQRATMRPGSAVGPYEVAVEIASADAEQLDALVVDTPQSIYFDARAKTPLRFVERPSIDLRSEVGEATNNGDGTYTVSYGALITNTGDVPLYRVGMADLVNEIYGDTIVENLLTTDTCTVVSFGQPLGPGQSCTRIQDVTLRPAAALGPWAGTVGVTADSPSFATVFEDAALAPVTFEETVTLETESTLSAVTNNGNGTYNIAFELMVENTGDVPLVDIFVSDAAAAYGDRQLEQTVTRDSCTGVALSTPLAPGGECRIELNQLLRPGAELGPFDLTTSVDAMSASTESASSTTTTNELTLTEAPRLELESALVSVETVDEGAFRVVANLRVENAGDVRVDDLALALDLEEVFPEASYRIGGVISNDFVIEEAFAAGESTNMLAPGQPIGVGNEGTVTLIVVVQPDGEGGPFVGDLRASGSSPAQNDVSAVIAAQVDLPSVSVTVAAQSVDNNQNGSYTVTTSYEISNDGSTALEFVRLVEDVEEIYAGTVVRTVSVDSDKLPVADLSDRRRGNDILEWGATLGTGSSAIVTTTVLVEPGNVLGPFVPTAITSASSPAGTGVFAEGFATEEVVFVEQPALRVSQRLLKRPAWNGTGTFDVSFAIDVVNDGDIELRSLQVRQDLLNALGATSQISVKGIRSDTLAVNSDFDGLGQPPQRSDSNDTEDLEEIEDRPTRDVGDTRLLAGWNTLPAGETATIELDLTITPENRGVYSTRVVVSANTPAGTGLGSGGDVIEANTLTRLSVQGEIGVAKQTIGEATVRPDGAVGVTYEILVENAGPFPLSNVEVHDQLSQAFGVGSTFVTSRVRIEAASPCEGFASSSYDGGTIDPVLVSGVDLLPGERCRIQYDAVVIPSKALPGPFRSSAFAIASDPFSGTVIDDSTDGTNIDPDGNQEPGDNDIATAVRVEVPLPAVTMEAEPLDSSTLDADQWFDFGYRITLENTGQIDIDTTRLTAALDDAWNVPFEVISVSSDDLIVSRSYDGESSTNLLERRNRLRAGTTAEIVLRVRAARPRSGGLDMPVRFSAESVTGDSITVELPEPVASLSPGDSVNAGFFGAMTTEEKRLVALGTAAMVLFGGVFIHHIVGRVRRFRKRRASQRAEQAARDDLFIDLRSIESRPRVRAHAPDLDLTNGAEHHSPRRRRGRRPAEKK